MESAELSFLVLGFFVIGLLFRGGIVWRWNLADFGYVPFAWMALIANGVLRVSPIPDQFERFFGFMFAALLLAGALAYAEREVPRAGLVVAAAVGAGITVLAVSGFEERARLTGTILESIIELCAAAIVFSASNRDRKSFVGRLIAPGLALVALVTVLDHLYSASGMWFGIVPWFLVGVPLATLQATSNFEKLRNRADEASAALRATVSELQATLEATTDGLLVVDRSGRHSSFNRNFGEMWRIPEEILEMRDDEASLESVMSMMKDPATFHDGVKALYAEPEKTSFDTLELNDGRIFERYSHPQRVGDEIVGRVWSFRDVTQRTQAEKVTARYQDDLEALVEERTRELLESKDRLREADRLASIGTLAAGVAHQINNPVAVILNSAEFALICKDEEDGKSTLIRALEDCVQEARRCGAIVRSMLQFARDESVETAVGDLNYIVRRACLVTESYARDHDVEVLVELCDETLLVRMSAIEIEQVVVNIVRNAIEALDDGGRVRVRTDRSRNLARVHVIDHGRGIEAEEQGRVFDPFYSTRINEGGTGLGLSVAHGIVAQHEGRLHVASQSGAGAEFVMELPIWEFEDQSSGSRP